jgi:hypothetical protein
LFEDQAIVKQLLQEGIEKSIQALIKTRSEPVRRGIGTDPESTIHVEIRKQAEYCGLVCLRCEGDEKVYSTGPEKGTVFAAEGHSCNATKMDSLKCEEGDLLYAYYHSHPGPTSFSGAPDPGTMGTLDYFSAGKIRRDNERNYGINKGGGFVAYNPKVGDFSSATTSAEAVVAFTDGASVGMAVSTQQISFTIIVKG